MPLNPTGLSRNQLQASCGFCPLRNPYVVGVRRIGVVQITFDRSLPFLNLRRPVGHDLPIDP